MKAVMVFGTFDILHPGHINFLRQAAKCGDLIVVVARDATVRRIKSESPRHDEKTRLQAVKNSGIAGKIILGSLKNKYAAIKKYRPDIIALGYDQSHFTEQLDCELRKLRLKTKIIRMKAHKPHKYKTSIIIKKYVRHKIHQGKHRTCQAKLQKQNVKSRY